MPFFSSGRLRSHWLTVVLGVVCLLSATSAHPQAAQPNIETIGEPWRGEPAVTQSVAEISARQALIDTQGRRIKPPRVRKMFEEFHPIKRPDPRSRKTSQWPMPSAVAPALEPLAPQEIGVNFAAVSFFDSAPAVPPDSMGAVGLTQVMVITNGRMKVFDKQGNLGPLDADLDTFFAPLLTSEQFSTDPHVRYDRLSGSWFITAITFTGAPREPVNNVLIAVSSGPIINGTSSFSLFKFRHDQAGLQQPNPDTGGFADYDTLGVDKFALYVGVNVIKISGVTINISSTGYVINKADLLNGVLTVTPFRQLGTFTANTSTQQSSGSGMDTPQGVDNDDPNASEGYFIGVDMVSFSVLNMRRISNPGGTPVASGNIALPVPSTAFPIPQPQSSGLTLDAVSDRLFAASIHTNKITGAKSLWTAHNIAVDANGVGTDVGDRNGSRWYEIRDLTAATPTVFQAGTVFDSSTDPTTNHFGFWMPSVAMSGQGHMALGASFASGGDRPGVAVAGRLAEDPAGITRLPATLTVAGEATYSDGLDDPPQRWGDYSQTVVDTTDDQTMWTFQEYANSGGLWTVRAIQLKAPRPQITSVNPPTVPPGVPSINVTVVGTGFFDPGPDPGGPGFVKHLSVFTSDFNVNSFTFNSPSSVTLNISTVGVTNGGQKDLFVTNPDGQFAFGENVLRVVFPTFTQLTSNQNPATLGQTVTFTATVFAGTQNFGAVVQFFDGNVLLGADFVVGGKAAFSTSSLSLGSHPITAKYVGDAATEPSTSSVLIQNVTKFPSFTALTSSPNPALQGASVTFTATLSAPGGGTPTGTVTFKDGGATLGVGTLSGGLTALSTSALSVGSHFITANYGGDSLHDPSSSNTVHQVVSAPGVGVVIVSNAPDPVHIGQVVTITIRVTNTNPSGPPAAYTLNQSLVGNFALLSASSDTGGACTGAVPIACSLGSLGPGEFSIITTVVRAMFGRIIEVTSSASSAAAPGNISFVVDNVRVRHLPFKF